MREAHGIRVPERHGEPGLCYAVMDDGLELPVIDLTHPAFALDPDPRELEALAEASLRNLERWSRVPPFLARLAARRSRLMRGQLAARGAVLDAMTTYLYKLGPANLGAWAGPNDRRLAASIVPVCMRRRLKAMAEMLAAALLAELSKPPDRHRAGGPSPAGRPVHLLNIGGGTAMDSLNALILARGRAPESLAGCSIAVHVLDTDVAGPWFAKRALAALSAPAAGGPLAGLNATLSHVPYDWANPVPLRRLLAAIRSEPPAGEEEGALLLGSSEGGLLEYGGDAQIKANLTALREAVPPGSPFVASLLQDSPLARAIQAHGKMTLRVIGLPALEAVAAGAGWRMGEVRDVGALYHVVALRAA